MAANQPVSTKLVTLAAIKGAHGVNGEVRLKLFGEGVKALSLYKSFNGGALTLNKARDDKKGGAIARFAEIADRNAAEALRGTLITVPRDLLPSLAQGEYYHADLLGLAVVTDAGRAIGQVCAVENFGAGDLVEIERFDKKRFMVPLTADAVPKWGPETLVVNADFIEE